LEIGSVLASPCGSICDLKVNNKFGRVDGTSSPCWCIMCRLLHTYACCFCPAGMLLPSLLCIWCLCVSLRLLRARVPSRGGGGGPAPRYLQMHDTSLAATARLLVRPCQHATVCHPCCVNCGVHSHTPYVVCLTAGAAGHPWW
jgi:hypothetical protein